MRREFVIRIPASQRVMSIGIIVLVAMASPSFATLSGRVEPDKATPPTSWSGMLRWRLAGPFGGEARRLAVDHQNPDICYLGTGDGQFFRSIDGGQSWHLVLPGFNQRGFSIQTIVVDRRWADRIFLGGWYVRGQTGGGLFVSEDQGKTWRPIVGLQGLPIRALVQSSPDPELFIAGALTGVYRSTNGGADWQLISPDHPDFKNIESVAVDPEDPNVIYVGTWRLPWKTTDGGQTWKLCGNSSVGMIDDSDIFSIAIDHSNRSVVYMSACSGIYRSENAGQSWTKIQGIPASSRRTQIIRQHPLNSSVIYAGTTQGLWMSSDHGQRWRLVTDRRLVVNDIVVHHLRPSIVMLATNQGIMTSRDNSHFSASNTGFSHWTVSTVKIDVENHSRVYAGVLSPGVYSGLFVSHDSGSTWEPYGNGLQGVDVYCLAQSSTQPEIMMVGTNKGLFRSKDRGENWSLVAFNQQSPRTNRELRQRLRRQSTKNAVGKQIAPLNSSVKVIELGFQSRVKDETEQVYCLTESSVIKGSVLHGDWQVIYQAGVGETLMCLVPSKKRPSVLYMGTNRGLKLSYDDGKTWRELSIHGESYPVQAVAEDEATDLLYVGTTLGAFRLDTSQDNYAWTRVGGGLPLISVSVIAVNPHYRHELIVGDQRYGGLFLSSDAGRSWDRIDVGFASSRVSTFCFDFRNSQRLFVGTLSGGIYVGNYVGNVVGYADLEVQEHGLIPTK